MSTQVDQIYVRNPSGQTQVATYTNTMTIGELKKSLNMYNVKLSHGRSPFCDHQTLKQADISPGDTLDASPSLPGGGCACRCTCQIL